jgi:hypothetical protein
MALRDKSPIPFPLSTNPGLRPQESGGRLINCYVDQLSKTAPAGVIYRRAPGLNSFGTSARSGYRGSIEVNSVLYSAFSGQMEKWTSAGGASVNVGALNGTKKGFFARNNAATPDKIFVDPDGNIATFTPTSVTNSYPDADLPAVNAVCAADGYLVFTTGNGRAYATNLNSTAVDPLSFGAAEGKPDALTRPIFWSGQLLLFGPVSLEIWTNQALSPFPFARSVVISRGIAGPYCVAGWEDGFGRALLWVGDDNRVNQLVGYEAQAVSPPDLDALIEAVADKTTLHTGVYMSRGHAFWQLTSPTWTWVFDLNTKTWHERKSYQALFSRIIGGIRCFEKWIVGDNNLGNMLQITSSTNQEVGNPFSVRLESGPVIKFPAGEKVGRSDFWFDTGVGIATGTDPIQTTPKVEISWSDDGGQNWYSPFLRDLGRQGEQQAIVSLVACTGRATWNGRRWRIDQADPVPFGFVSGIQSVNPKVSDS